MTIRKKFTDFKSGGGDAVIKALVGFVLSAVLGFIPSITSIPASYIGLFQFLELVILIGGILVIERMESWGFFYLAGWLFATWIMCCVGLVEHHLFVLYAISGGVVLIAKVDRLIVLPQSKELT